MGLVVLMISVDRFNWDWSGFNGQTGPNVLHYQPAKTLWAWLQLPELLAIPVAVALGTAWFTRKQGQVSDAEHEGEPA